MSRGQGGTRRWVRLCPICGNWYVLTNFMKLPNRNNHHSWSVRARRGEYAFYDSSVGLIDNAHLLSCFRKETQ